MSEKGSRRPKLERRTIDVIPQVKDPCKEQKVGRCAE